MNPRIIKKEILDEFYLKKTLNIDSPQIPHPTKNGMYIIRMPLGDDWSYSEVDRIDGPRDWCRLDVLVGRIIVQINTYNHLERKFRAIARGYRSKRDKYDI